MEIGRFAQAGYTKLHLYEMACTSLHYKSIFIKV